MMHTDHDHQTANAAYRNALECAKSEFDALMPAYREILERVRLLRQLIHASAALVNDPIDDDSVYAWPSRTMNESQLVRRHGHRQQREQTLATPRSTSTKA